MNVISGLLQKRRSVAQVTPFGVPGGGNSVWISVVTVVAVLFLWWLITQLGVVKPLFLPSPEAVLAKFEKIGCINHNYQQVLVFFGLREEVAAKCFGFSDSTLWEHTYWSLYRVISAFVIAIILGIPIGIAMGMNRVAKGIFYPLIEFYRPIPPLAYLPLIIIWFGIEDKAKIIVIFLSCFAPLVISAQAGVRSVTIEQIHAAYSMGATQSQVIWNVVLKAAMPEILTGMRIAIAFGWTTLVAAELVAAKAGLGVMVLNAARFLATDIVFLGIVMIGIIAFIFDLGMRALESRLVPWKGKV